MSRGDSLALHLERAVTIRVEDIHRAGYVTLTVKVGDGDAGTRYDLEPGHSIGIVVDVQTTDMKWSA